jgi:uncharacterized membrane protein YcaP (DUF421 family)
MKQTAVEWLLEQLKDVKYNTLEKNGYSIALEKIHKQAKEMEKQQIIDACNLQRNDYKGMPTYNKSGEQYYNETYNQ